MLKRTLVLSLDKKKKKNADDTDDVDYDIEEHAAVINLSIDRAIRRITEAVLTYIVADTVRKVIVHKLTK